MAYRNKRRSRSIYSTFRRTSRVPNALVLLPFTNLGMFILILCFMKFTPKQPILILFIVQHLWTFLEQEQGSYNGKNQIQITPYAEDASSTLLHEIQHWVQQTEGFAEGGNEKSAVNAIMDTFEAEEIIGEVRTAIQAKLKKINAKQELIYKVVANIPDVISRIEGIEEKKKALRKFYGSPNWMDTEEGVALQVEEESY
jgi:hypothetical protein